MYSPMRLFLALPLVGCVFAGANPVEIKRGVKSSDDGIACHQARDYSAEWFLKNTKPQYSAPLLNNALFYSAGMSKSARAIAKETGRTTIWDVWPCYLYNHLNEHTNPMRCIHENDKERELFFMHMSRAFAMKARNFSTVLHSAQNYPDPPKTGIWGRVEFPVLERGGVVNWLEKINETRNLSEIFWKRPKAFALDLLDSIASHYGDLKRRAVGEMRVKGPPSLPPQFAEHCLAPKQLEFFDKVSW